MRKNKGLLSILAISVCLSIPNVSCGGNESEPPVPTGPITEVITRYVSASTFKQSTAFNSGADGINTYRIPTMTTSKNGTLIVACEARIDKWNDRSRTNVVLKRSTDKGQTWSAMKTIMTQSSDEAMMDPCLLCDLVTGRIFLFASCWENASSSAVTNKAYMSYSDDDGVNWSPMKDISREFCAEGRALTGCGPGSGFQMTSSKFPNRLIIPTRQIEIATGKGEMRTVYSDDNGATWQSGNAASPASELMMAEAADGKLILNMRNSAKRYVSRSNDGGVNWSTFSHDATLVTPENGCQGSILGKSSMVFFCCPYGGARVEGTDNRYDLTLWRSSNSGDSWTQKFVLYNMASGYSCMSHLPNGDMALVFEAADSRGFINTGGARPAGWMQLRVMIIPADIFNKECWIKP